MCREKIEENEVLLSLDSGIKNNRNIFVNKNALLVVDFYKVRVDKIKELSNCQNTKNNANILL